jgi:LysR family cys regulon transcriptional activator
MLISELTYVCEIVDQGFNVSRAAIAQRTSQPSISRHIQSLERELGFQIFTRSKRRILGLTKPGEQLLDAARDIIAATRSLKHIGEDYVSEETGTLVVSSSHTQARYVLPAVIQEFSRRNPKVQVILLQGNPGQVEERLRRGEADVGIISRSPLDPIPPGIALIPCYDQQKVLITPPGHPLLDMERVTIAALAEYPLITFDTQFSTHSQVMRAFTNAGYKPNVTLSAIDADVIKTYVKHGLGVAILGDRAYNPSDDHGLCAINVQHLFQANKIYVGLEKQLYVRRYVTDFITLFAPNISRVMIMKALKTTRGSRK